MPKKKQVDKLLHAVKKAGVFRARDAAKIGSHPHHLARLAAEGRLMRVGRGLYAHPDWIEAGNANLAEICRQIPEAVICLISALYYHEIGTQLPYRTWVAIPRKANPPQSPETAVFLRYTKASHKAGVEKHQVEGATIRVYGIAKTVADCWKYRNRVGLDVALEALKDVLRRRLATPDEILKYAEINRVATVMKPYLEALV